MSCVCYGSIRKVAGYENGRTYPVGQRLLFFSVLVSALWCGQILNAQDVVALANEHLRVALDKASASLMECRDLATSHNFAQADSGCWELKIFSGEKALTLVPSQAGSCQNEAAPGAEEVRRLTWSRFPEPFPPGMSVEVTVMLDNQDNNSLWRISVTGLPRAALRQVRFPILNNNSPQADEHLAVPQWMGQAVAEPRRFFGGANGKGRRSEWHYPGELSMQCLAFWGAGSGLYLACNDASSFRKGFAVSGDGRGGLSFEVVHWPERGEAGEAGWRLPYEVVLGTFQGDWFAAAERYRSWATNQAWAVESRLSQGAVPRWLPNTALWVWNRGRSQGVLKPAMELRRRLGLPVSVFWHWWHGCAYDTGFPEYLPPREGAENFASAVARARKQGINALVYMNQRLWGMTTRSWTNEGAAAWAVKGEDGKIHPEIYNTFTRAPCASMCLGTAFWRDKYASLAEHAVMDLGVSGIYMDQACLSLSCFDPAHGHPVGGGAYWVNGFRLLASDIRQRCRERAKASKKGDQMGLCVPGLAGEGCGEPWLSQLDVMLSLQVSKERYAGPDGWETIPFFHAVYHPYVILFGNYSSLTMPPYDELWPSEFAPEEPLKLLHRSYSTQFCLEQARAFVWGQQPTLANFTPGQLKTRTVEIDYVMRLARVRQRSSKYLLRGTFLQPPILAVPEVTIPMSRLSIYAGQQGGLKTFEKKVSLALAAAWRSPDGQVALALASISEQPQQVTLSIPARNYGLAEGSRIMRVDHRGSKQIGTTASPETTLAMQLPARAVWVLEFRAR